MANHKTIRRQRAQGATFKWLCNAYGLSWTELKTILADSPPAKIDAGEQRRRAIEELRREGHSEEVIRANFGA